MYLQNIHEKKIWTHEIPMRKIFGPTKHLREKISDPKVRWHDDTRSTTVRDARYLAHSVFR